MTPTTHPGRFTDREREFFERGMCCWLTSYGTIAGLVFCDTPRIAGFHLCRRHALELAGARPSAAQLRDLRVYLDDDGPGITWRRLKLFEKRGWIAENGAVTDAGYAALALGGAQ